MQYSSYPTLLYRVAPANGDRPEEDGVIKPLALLPGLRCPKCGVYIGMRRLPFECPEKISAFLKRRSSGPLEVSELATLNRLWSQEDKSKEFGNLQPGDIFGTAAWNRRESKKHIFWPAFSNVVTSEELFEKVNEVAAGLIRPMQIKDSPFVEWVFQAKTVDFPAKDSTNKKIQCELCLRSHWEYSPDYQKECDQQESERWIYYDNCLSSDIFSSHIFFPGFIVTARIAQILQQFADIKTEIHPVEVRCR